MQTQRRSRSFFSPARPRRRPGAAGTKSDAGKSVHARGLHGRRPPETADRWRIPPVRPPRTGRVDGLSAKGSFGSGGSRGAPRVSRGASRSSPWRLRPWLGGPLELLGLLAQKDGEGDVGQDLLGLIVQLGRGLPLLWVHRPELHDEALQVRDEGVVVLPGAHVGDALVNSTAGPKRVLLMCRAVALANEDPPRHLAQHLVLA
mmetsp:Transcript_35985/g.113222  ORF Transcript_35985/g.113222 Transcript_35985/m.113222 type:complete len:203 (+) Transcript_35985:7-615(+)